MLWINVKDRLPEIRKDVLTYDGEYMLIEYLLNDEDVFTWSCSSFEDITHWMLLPEPPKKEE
jgi:hypothetical protein